MFNWFRKKQDIPIESSDEETGKWDEFFKYLIEEITDPANAKDVVLIGKQGSRKSPQERFHAYLLLERYLTNLNLDKQYNKSELRENIYSRFPFLRKDPVFKIIFLPDKDARVYVTKKFLEFCLEHAAETLSKNDDNFIAVQLEKLSKVEISDSEADIFAHFAVIAGDLFDWISDKYGIGLAASVFHHSYEMNAFLYKGHEAFSSIISVLPKPIITAKQLSLLTQKQVESLFLEKLEVTERLNDALHLEIKDKASTEKRLRGQEIMLRSIIASALDAIITINEEGRVIEWNPSAESLFGYSPDEAKDRLLTDLIIPVSLREAHKAGFTRFLKTREGKIVNKGRVELPAARKDGKQIKVELTITSVEVDGKYFFNGFLREIR